MTDQQVDMRYVRDNFGHSSISTTSGHLRSEDDRASIDQILRSGWQLLELINEVLEPDL